MNDIIAASQETSAEDRATHALPRSGADRASHSAAVRSPSNWAWATPTSQYDWMDGHAPFAALD
ncbi:hypothetical protein E1N52_12640 [Paraburkholderia guartelaensis]|jgi:hypothetical protein|uniref:Uncharacterized protein n=1 Tax=Paraburkholderia guartelaensis TaxID=2546446 RepID=A0A4R5LGG2_9BURK|nr:hypothetical protein [Paraburkholderia guartelaensis]TDG08217.1 hypothetical protein E1N52_12640 [Paraburkholderia guartelaensis]